MPSEPGAGIRGFSDFIHITVDSGDPCGEEGEFEEFVLGCLREWYDGAAVLDAHETELLQRQEDLMELEYLWSSPDPLSPQQINRRHYLEGKLNLSPWSSRYAGTTCIIQTIQNEDNTA